MARFSITLFLVVLLYVYTAEGRVLRESLIQVGEDGKFDKLILSLTSPPSFCKKMCLKPIPGVNTLTIHGLWPSPDVRAKDTKIDTKCRPKFDVKLIPASLLDQMNKKWPNLKNKPNYKLWKHEFEKHGMCLSNPSVFRPQLEYFQDAIDLYNKYAIETILQNEGVVPSIHGVYTLSHVNSALYEGLGVYPEVHCFVVDGIQYLLEVRMCFDLYHQPINCGNALKGGGSCNPNIPIKYLPTMFKDDHQILTESGDSAVQFLVDIAEMDARNTMMDEEEDDQAELWENLNQNVDE